MANVKYVPTPYTLYDRTGICRMLEKQAKKGWLLEKIGVFAWKYRRIEPKQLHFAVTYSPNVSAYDPEDTERELDFREFCALDGWIFAASSNQMQIFYNEKENPVPIDTDPELELNNIHKSMKKSMLPVYWLLLFNAVVQVGTQIFRLTEEPVAVLSSNVSLCSLLMMSVLLVILVRELAAYYLWHRKALRLAREEGKFLETKAHAGIVVVILFFMLGFFGVAMLSVNRSVAITGGIMAVGVIAMSMLAVLFTRWMKQQKISAEDNRNYTIIAAVFLAFAMLTVSHRVVMEIPDERNEEPLINLSGGSAFPREMPITIRDLGGEEGENPFEWVDVESSFLLGRAVYRQDAWHPEEEDLTLRYVVLQVKWDALLDICLEDYLHMYEYEKMSESYRQQFYGEFLPTDEFPWGAQRAWQLRRNGEMETEYLLVFGSRIVNFQCFRELTAEEMGDIGHTLGIEQNFGN